MHRSKSAPAPRRLRLERLEDRQLLAGNVTVEFVDSPDGRDVVITGDNSANYITISTTTKLDEYVVRGIGAKINNVTGGSFIFRLSGSSRVYTDDLIINMNGGDDTVAIRGGTGINDLDAEGSIRIDMGQGSDQVNLDNVEAITGSLSVNLDSGARDRLYAKNIRAGTVISVNSAGTSAQKTTISIDGAFADTLSIALDDSIDVVNLNNINVDELRVFLYGGNDSLNIKKSTVRDSSNLKGGDGTKDRLNFYQNSPRTFTHEEFLSPTYLNTTYY